MPKVTIQELVNATDLEPFNDQMAMELAELSHKYSCIPSALAHILDTATQGCIALRNADVTTEEGTNITRLQIGAIKGQTSVVEDIIQRMEEAQSPREEDETPRAPLRVARPRTPTAKKKVAKKAPAKKRK